MGARPEWADVPGTAYYNEIDPYAAAWLRNLIAAGRIAPGVVDERDIRDVLPSEIQHFTQCHFFAGVGVWSLALRRAGWPDDRPVWTGSCPCQPFSAAGAGAGFADERHLWPHFHWLIEECRPPAVAGEQVASAAVDPWIDLVQADMEVLGYAFGAVAFPSVGVGAPHIRDRTYWVSDANHARLEGRHAGALGDERAPTERSGGIVGLADANGAGPQSERREPGKRQSPRAPGFAPSSTVGGLADTHGGTGGQGRADVRGWPTGGDAQSGAGSGGGGVFERVSDSELRQRPDGQPGIGHVDDAGGRQQGTAALAGLRGDLRPGPTNGFWRDADWLGCTDGKWRPVEPGTFPLAHGAASRVGRLRAYGNAINAEAARVFIECAFPDL